MDEKFVCCEGLATLKAESAGNAKWLEAIDQKVDRLTEGNTTMTATLNAFKWIVATSIPATAVIVTIIFKIMEK
jgi:hypothetical protein